MGATGREWSIPGRSLNRKVAIERYLPFQNTRISSGCLSPTSFFLRESAPLAVYFGNAIASLTAFASMFPRCCIKQQFVRDGDGGAVETFSLLNTATSVQNFRNGRLSETINDGTHTHVTTSGVRYRRA